MIHGDILRNYQK